MKYFNKIPFVLIGSIIIFMSSCTINTNIVGHMPVNNNNILGTYKLTSYKDFVNNQAVGINVMTVLPCLANYRYTFQNNHRITIPNGCSINPCNGTLSPYTVFFDRWELIQNNTKIDFTKMPVNELNNIWNIVWFDRTNLKISKLVTNQEGKINKVVQIWTKI